MDITTSLLTFSVAATVLAMTPGLDTALVLRQLMASGAAAAWRAALGVAAGCLLWGALVASGLGVLLAASPVAFTLLKWSGAAYLVWQGLRLLLQSWRASPVEAADTKAEATALVGQPPSASAFTLGFFTNALNPKIGVFYVAFLPQFVAQGFAAGPYMLALACIHVGVSLLWFLTLIAAARSLVPRLQQVGVRRALDALTGLVFVGFGAKLFWTR